MATDSIKIRAQLKDGVTTVKALMTHPMETGARKDKDGSLIPAHFIQEVSCEAGGRKLLTAHWSGGVSKNPYLSFKFGGASVGDLVKLSWMDNKGESASAEAEIN
ncbi:MAG: thiosulfate oxidation carrier complex protein SoxZ [Gammaproteobacteria bacterium]|nr:thiosulfate oxidation carrier complex protein SoxZ [Gammaproteobacteria bacterium]MCP5407501.1 thiosulfate oxidation carrier complex protein SoxZ [Chromatiaceae bacterium]MCP5441773.1 thiosulfate oxidation carrier complex protein SoxZ [Chromatiaceae bacterium]